MTYAPCRALATTRSSTATHSPAALEVAGIGYAHVAGLGGFRHSHPDSLNMGWRNVSFRGYADYMQTNEFAENLASLFEQGKARTNRADVRRGRAVAAIAVLARPRPFLGLLRKEVSRPSRR